GVIAGFGRHPMGKRLIFIIMRTGHDRVWSCPIHDIFCPDICVSVILDSALTFFLPCQTLPDFCP
ncbi:MAG: hypothetical protein ACRCTU_04065, partial [Zoogloea sp.]|uniref:hypothetical protein n=1 Tax=Zoogloea sp. TaxID=49181 RepID=UPI003F3904CA